MATLVDDSHPNHLCLFLRECKSQTASNLSQQHKYINQSNQQYQYYFCNHVLMLKSLVASKIVVRNCQQKARSKKTKKSKQAHKKQKHKPPQTSNTMKVLYCMFNSGIQIFVPYIMPARSSMATLTYGAFPAKNSWENCETVWLAKTVLPFQSSKSQKQFFRFCMKNCQHRNDSLVI